ncbi:hypothetical protein HOK51_11155 [Candidatus Woesearchaeota archaeon]|nr:hypothetical protein [Candidatus Woesearchaeota archaeon]MBT6520380.1 hypothetical protein [Candidatus Woesearchaeota archaeon]
MKLKKEIEAKLEVVGINQIDMAKQLLYSIENYVQLMNSKNSSKINKKIMKRFLLSKFNDLKLELECEKKYGDHNKIKPISYTIQGSAHKKTNWILSKQIPLIKEGIITGTSSSLKNSIDALHKLVYVCIQKEKDLALKRFFNKLLTWFMQFIKLLKINRKKDLKYRC